MCSSDLLGRLWIMKCYFGVYTVGGTWKSQLIPSSFSRFFATGSACTNYLLVSCDAFTIPEWSNKLVSDLAQVVKENLPYAKARSASRKRRKLFQRSTACTPWATYLRAHKGHTMFAAMADFMVQCSMDTGIHKILIKKRLTTTTSIVYIIYTEEPKNKLLYLYGIATCAK